MERGRILLAIAGKIREKSSALATMESAESGKPAWHSPIEIEIAAQYFEFYGGLVNTYQGETIGLRAGLPFLHHARALCVSGRHHPVERPAQPGGPRIAPALAAGNATRCQPSEFTVEHPIELARLACEECGLPPVC